MSPVTLADSDPGSDQDGADSINLDALARLGSPRKPRPESKTAVAMGRLQGQAPNWCLVAWVVFVLVAVSVRIPPLSASSGHGSSTNLTQLVVGGNAAAGGAVIAVLAIRSKQRDRAAGTEPAQVMSVSWSTRWLLAGVGAAVFGIALLWSVK
jgi:hypothetical protein